MLCPGLVKSRLIDSERNRPDRLRNDPSEERRRRRRFLAYELDLRREMDEAMTPEMLARTTFEAIVNGRFMVLTHSWVEEAVERRLRALLCREPPPPP